MNTFILVVLSVIFILGSSIAQADRHHLTIATELQEVRTGSINGKDYLIIHLSNAVGPPSCHGSVLKVDTSQFQKDGQQQSIETIALAALLMSDSVMITVPLHQSDCVDGKPTLIDMYLLPASPEANG